MVPVAELISEHEAVRDQYNAFLKFRQSFPGKPREAVAEPSEAEQDRAHELWREILRRALMDDAVALAAVIKHTDESTPMTKERIEALLRSEDSFGDAS